MSFSGLLSINHTLLEVKELLNYSSIRRVLRLSAEPGEKVALCIQSVFKKKGGREKIYIEFKEEVFNF